MIRYKQALAVCRIDPEAQRKCSASSANFHRLKAEVTTLKAENVALHHDCQSLCQGPGYGGKQSKWPEQPPREVAVFQN